MSTSSNEWTPTEPSEAYTCTPKDVFSTKNNPMCGWTLPQLWKVLWHHGDSIDWLRYSFRICFLTLLATINTSVAIVEYLLYERKISQQKINKRPVFILGHPRSGTTLIHNVLSKDPQFNYCSTFQCGFPSTFLCMKGCKGVLSGVIDDTRPMDNMELNFDLPQEEELATTALSGGISPYMCIILIKECKRFWDYFSFETASAKDFQCWRSSFMYFLKKVTFANGGVEKRMVIKSPVHTARVRVLLEMFPDAQFIYVHRDPYTVFQSAAHMADAYYWSTYLHKPKDSEVTDFVFNQYECLYKEYMATRSLIPKGNLVEVRFEELERDTPGEIRRIYRELGLKPNPSSKFAETDKYCKQLTGFVKNAHKEITPGLRRQIAERWGDSFRELGYKI